MPIEHAASVGPSAHAPAVPAIPPGDSDVRAVRDKATAQIAKMARKPEAVSEPEPDLFSVGFGLLSIGSTSFGGQGLSTTLVRAEDWATLGCLMFRGRKRPGGHSGYMRAEFLGGTVFEAYTGNDEPEVTGLYHNGRPIGCWRAVDFSYPGRFRQPLGRELWAGSRRVGLVDTVLMSSGAAVLELDPEGRPLIPLRIRRGLLIAGNPLAELLKATPLGRRLGPRNPSLDLVLAPQVAWLNDPADRDLVFAASLWLRAIEGFRSVSSE